MALSSIPNQLSLSLLYPASSSIALIFFRKILYVFRNCGMNRVNGLTRNFLMPVTKHSKVAFRPTSTVKFLKGVMKSG